MKPLALTMGEPGGIGPDITLLAWQHYAANKGAPFAVFADSALLRARATQLGISLPIEETNIENAARVFQKALPVIPLQNTVAAKTGTSEIGNAAAVIESITRTVEAVHKGNARAIVTNPIQKATLQAAGFPAPGHTEFLAALDSKHTGTEKRAVMMLCCDELRTVPLTIHIPLRDVPRAIDTAGLIETAQIVAKALAEKFGIAHPRLVVCGLNPHAGENGSIGDEEKKYLEPAIARLQANGLDVKGPLAADSLFHEAARKTYDAAIAMYHDQALIPVKTLAFERAVNVTLGLSFVRTSPDHGTALDIAGTGKASPYSLIEALKLAAKLSA